MQIEGVHGERIELARPDHATDPTSFLLRVQVVCRGFSGATEVWIAHDAWARFVAAAAQLERDRRGSATLEGSSPRELALTIRAIDRAGHIAIEGHVGVRGAWEALLTFSPIELDPTALSRVVEGLRAIDRAAP